MFSSVIKQLRKQRGLNQSDFANLAGVSFSTYRRWEKGERTPNVATLHALASALGVSVDYLLTGTEDAPESNAELKTKGGVPTSAAATDNPNNSGIIGDNNINNNIIGSNSTVNAVPAPRSAPADVLLYIGPDGARVELPNTPENAVKFKSMVSALID